MPWLVSAVDRSLLEGLRQVGATHKIRLRSVTPYLMQAFNRFRLVFKADPAWLVINEPGHSLFTLLNNGEFAAINGVSHSVFHELPMLLDRENLIASLPEPCKTVYLYAPFGEGLPEMSAMGYDFHRLKMAIPEGFPGDGLYALALGGAL